VSFGIALFVSAYFGGEQKTLGVWFGVLIILGIVLHLFGMWLTKPQILTLHDGYEQCSVDERGRCQKSLRRIAKLQLLALPAILFLCSFGGACLLAFAVTDPKTAGQNEPAANLVPLNVSIADIQTGADAYRDSPAFLRDNLDKLETEQQRAKRPDCVIATIESEKLASYGRFCWMISLRGDYPRKNFALSVRAAYLVHSGEHFTFDDLRFSGAGDPFTAIIVEVPPSRDGDKVLIPLAIYARITFADGKPLDSVRYDHSDWYPAVIEKISGANTHTIHKTLYKRGQNLTVFEAHDVICSFETAAELDARNESRQNAEKFHYKEALDDIEKLPLPADLQQRVKAIRQRYGI